MRLFSNDLTMLAAYREGRPEALESVYRAHVQMVDRYVRSLARSSGHADFWRTSAIADLVQDVFVRAFSPSARLAYDGLRDFAPYLMTIARNCFVDVLRASRREVLKTPEELEAVLEDAPAEPLGDLDGRTFEVVMAYVRGLPGDLEGVYQQRFVLGLSQEAASAALGMSRRAVRTAENRLRKGLRVALVRAGISLRELTEAPLNSSTRIAVSAVLGRHRS